MNQSPPRQEAGRKTSDIAAPLESIPRLNAKPAYGPSPQEGWEGYYLVYLPDGFFRVFRVAKQDLDSSFAPGELIISYLSGPVSPAKARDRDYQQFAFLKDDGIEARAFIWKRFQNDEESHRLRESLDAFIADPRICRKAFAGLLG